LTGASGFEWQATDTLKFGTTGFYTQRSLSDATTNLIYVEAGPGNNTYTALGSTSAVTHITSLGTPYLVDTLKGKRAYINQLSAENLQSFNSVRSNPTKQQTWAITPTAEFKNDDWRVAMEGTISRAETRANELEVDMVQNSYRNLGPAGLNGITASVFTGGTDMANAVIAMKNPNPSQIPTPGYILPTTGGSPTQLNAPMPGQSATTLGDRMGLTGTNALAHIGLDAVQFSVQRKFQDSFFSKIELGARYEANTYTSKGSRNTALGAKGGSFTPDMSKPMPYASDFFGGKAGGYTTAWRTVDINQVLEALTPVDVSKLPGQFGTPNSPGVFLSLLGWSIIIGIRTTPTIISSIKTT
jgi:hypothetical protein